ncbi:MAG: hypothetical protein KDK91_34040 [Gammaproteobacteria bacterium]|nr:hypothetical protein [Gammaproteobacteria bacterium]
MSAKRRHLTIAAESSTVDAWRADLVRDAKNEHRAVFVNILAIVRHDPEIKGSLQYNSLLGQVEIVRRLPGVIDTGLGPIKDVHVHGLVAWLGERYGLHAKPGQVSDAITLAAQENVFDPARAYMESLAWDGVERVQFYAERYLGAEPSAYNRRVSTIIFVSVAARVFQPGCKVDTMVILEGAQGCGKTTAVRHLLNPDWFVEVTESFDSPEVVRQVRGAHVGEIGEMSSLSRSEFNRTKQFITQQIDRVREPYARFVASYPRRCVFFGTTNQDDWNRDPTGARRFLPIRVSAFNMQAFLGDRDQLWAEAVALYRDGADFWTLPETATDEQDARYDHDAWSDPIAAWLAVKADGKYYPPSVETRATDLGGGVRRASAAEILQHALNVAIGKQSKADQMRVANIMRKLEWQRERTWCNGARTVKYCRPREDGDDVPF